MLIVFYDKPFGGRHEGYLVVSQIMVKDWGFLGRITTMLMQ